MDARHEIIGMLRASLAIILLALMLLSAVPSARAWEPDGLSVASLTVGRYPMDAQSTSGPRPPAAVNVTGAVAATAATTVTISGVPAYTWHHGCGPTAGWYGYGLLGWTGLRRFGAR